MNASETLSSPKGYQGRSLYLKLRAERRGSMSTELFESAWCDLEWTYMVSLEPANWDGRILPAPSPLDALKVTRAWVWLNLS